MADVEMIEVVQRQFEQVVAGLDGPADGELDRFGRHVANPHQRVDPQGIANFIGHGWISSTVRSGLVAGF